MFHRRAHHRLQAWFAIAILLLGALAPSISAALSHARGDALAWQEICSSSATPRGAAKQAPAQPSSLDLLTMGHCAMCHLHASDLALPPPAAQALALRLDLGFAMPERFYSANGTPHAWRKAPARAPPLSV
ncbi:DUF2946 domain-containing protein [Roseateles violae]|uniref:DUF2946 domain-containing protein n=1 Tax=Roseateles violae TaxID=3058042 RepID=A0ABT8DYT2_9BURK|nr:DUF2946 domain-containing protein [Pelomonas sp. PFR6]MDN3922735.1 DUF2946 domain-containing protein [Pelomonas sp. PFR6]